MQPLIAIEDLSVVFSLPHGRLTAVDGVSFDIPQGGTVALVGESGSGKSMIAQALLGIVPHPGRVERGRILFADPATPGPAIDLLRLPDDAAWRRIRGGRIALIFQEPMSALSPLHRIGDQVSEALLLHRGCSKAEGLELTEQMLRLVGFPDPARAMSAYTFELSGGLRQRATIAMALVCRPALLIADEPTTALDVTIQAQILALVRELQGQLGMAILLITHDLGVVASMADEVVVMWRGRIMERGATGEIFADPRHPYLRKLMAAVPTIGHPHAPPVPPAGPPALRLEAVEKRFQHRSQAWSRRPASETVAVAGVDLALERGECLGLVGESGCGKSTLMKLVLRAFAPSAGRVLWRPDPEGPEEDVARLAGPRLAAYRRDVALVFQDPQGSLNPRMTVGAIIAEPMEIHGFGDGPERRARVARLLARVGLDPAAAARYPHAFSGGQRQRIGIARALALDPQILLCDEPVSALDVSIQAQILDLIDDLRRERGLSVLFVSHNLAVVDRLADRIAVMCAGRLVELAPPAQLFAAPRHPYTKALLAAVPLPDPARRLDFAALRAERRSDPAAWEPAFRVVGDDAPPWAEAAPGHFVRMRAASATKAAA